MKYSQRCIDLISLYEGFRSHPYLDPVGIPTIGFGNITWPNGTKVSMKDGAISREEAVKMLCYHIDKQIMPNLDTLISVKINQNQVDAIISFCYNVGVDNFRNSSMRRLINSNLMKQAGNEFQRWTKSSGKVLPGLTKRREDEQKLFNTPVDAKA